MTEHYEYDAEKEIQSLNNQEHTKEAKKKLKSGKLAVAFACMALVCAIAVAVAAICFIGNSSQKVEALSKQIEILAASVDTNTETQENGVTIAGQYEIKPTEIISDAYKSGDSSKLDKKQKETLKMASEVLSEIITDGMSDFEKETAVYDWMTSSLQNDTGMLVVVPTTQQDCENPYGVLKYHNAVCVGYATTFRLFMQMLDIDCMVVHNNDLYHSWDLVNIDDNWYHVDIYSDAGMGGYQHFNLNDDMMLAQQNWDTSYFPAADSLELNKYYMSRIAIDDIYDVPAKMREEIDKKSSFVCFEFTKELSNEDMAVVQSFMNVLSNCLSNSYVENFAFSVTQNGWTTDSKTGHSMVSATFDYNSDDNYAENYEIDYDRIGEILSESFGDVLPDIKDYSNGNYGYDYNDDYYNDGNYGY